MKNPITYSKFEQTLNQNTPPANWPEALQSLWYQRKGDWEASHNIAQDISSPIGSLIHAHLHRVEGDDWNAKYWYRKAGRTYPQVSAKDELKNLIQEVLKSIS